MMILPEPSRNKRSVHCHRCGAGHTASAHAAGTTCPSCGAVIGFTNIVVGKHRSAPVDTRGDLIIEKKGYLYSGLSVCGNAVIQGGIHGALICEGRLIMHASGLQAVRIDAGEILVPGGTVWECPFPIHAVNMTVRGKLKASIVISGKLNLLRGGMIEGTVYARSIQVDRGGHLLGKLHITTAPQPQQNKPKPERQKNPLSVKRSVREFVPGSVI